MNGVGYIFIYVFVASFISQAIPSAASVENLWGSNTSAYGFSFLSIISRMIIAETMEDVIPHF